MTRQLATFAALFFAFILGFELLVRAEPFGRALAVSLGSTAAASLVYALILRMRG
ncbi:MAG: hypothetical protein ACU0BF_05515 [Paracoccaceae bacterium]